MEFKINFELNDKKKLFEYWDDIIKNNIWSHGKYTELFRVIRNTLEDSDKVSIDNIISSTDYLDHNYIKETQHEAIVKKTRYLRKKYINSI